MPRMLPSVLTSAAAAFAGALLVITRRQVLTAGVMVALALVPALALAVMSALAGSWETLVGASVRWFVDVVLVVGASAVVLYAKRRIDRRVPSSDTQAAGVSSG